ncbi:MAG: succinate dehydrogenase [Pirellulales bacterium]|nr:succinate dehydrogenase [Pirellulales bacterium]
MDSSPPSFLNRYDFLIRRLHSLSGLIPVGAYMVVHLVVNASVVNSPETFQNNVLNIHKFGSLLPLIEWTFIFIPILFHAIVGIMLVAGGLPNTHNYPFEANYRYTLQRATGVIAFFFIGFHVFHMHGWFHNSAWMNYVVQPLGGGVFKPYNATSTGGLALQSLVAVAIYAVGVVACVYHLANGIWTMGITWGAWTSPAAQRRALYVCGAFGFLLLAVSAAALFGMRAAVDTPEKLEAVRQREAEIYKYRSEVGDVLPDEHKMYHPPEASDAQPSAAAAE